MKILALDVGTKTIGVATGWTSNQITQPLVTLQRKSVKKDAVQLQTICQQQSIEHLVVGLPLELDDQEGRSARLARQVGDWTSEQKLNRNSNVSIHHLTIGHTTRVAQVC